MLVLSVQELLGYLKELLESNAALADLWISGEVTNLTRSQAGHMYFTLKDAGGQMRCAFFRRQNAGMALQPGTAVLAHGRINIYEARGELNFVADFVNPQGAGIFAAQFERLRAKLEAEGLFDAARKRPLPPFPRRIGVVTSPTGAVLQDICTVVGRRWPLAEIVLAPTAVQGDGAADGVVAAIEGLNLHGRVDVIIVARGGGSREELAAFDDERVPRAIYASRVPVISAVGHEIDVTLADYAADLRAPTPSVAGEMVAPDRIDVALRVGGLSAMLVAAMQTELDHRTVLLQRQQDALDDARPDLDAAGERLAALRGRADALIVQVLRNRRTAVDTRSLQLASLSPVAVLERGYAMVHNAAGQPLAAVADAYPGDALTIRVRDGAFAAEVKRS